MFLQVNCTGFPSFLLERWLSEHAVGCTHNLGGCSVPPIELGQLVDGFRLDTKLCYGSTRGSEALRNALAEWYSRIDKENVLITTGTAEANFLVINALLGKNDEIIVTVPSYMQVHGIVQAIGAKTKELHLDKRNRFRLDLEQLKQMVSSKTKVIQFTNPNNPTGNKFSSDEVREISEIGEDAGSMFSLMRHSVGWSRTGSALLLLRESTKKEFLPAA